MLIYVGGVWRSSPQLPHISRWKDFQDSRVDKFPHIREKNKNQFQANETPNPVMESRKEERGQSVNERMTLAGPEPWARLPIIGIMGIMGNCGMNKSTCSVRGPRRTLWVARFNISTYVLSNFYYSL